MPEARVRLPQSSELVGQLAAPSLGKAAGPTVLETDMQFSLLAPTAGFILRSTKESQQWRETDLEVSAYPHSHIHTLTFIHTHLCVHTCTHAGTHAHTCTLEFADVKIN